MARTFYQIINLLRYRFLLFAGLLPYVLASAVAFHLTGQFRPELFLVGLGGLVLALIGVEAFNEYFDWVGGTDRVFQLDPKPVTRRTFFLGLIVFALAGLLALYLTWRLGGPIIIIASIGFLCALFYLAPPLKLTYRGLGELTIAFAYGPFMMSGSYYLQTRQLDIRPLFVSILPALLLFMIALVNEVPDYYQDRLVGKRNICVRLGRESTVKLYGLMALVFYTLLIGSLLTGNLPSWAWLTLSGMPLLLASYLRARKTYDEPRQFIGAIRYLLIHYVWILGILITAYFIG